MDCSLSGSCVHGIFHTRILERVTISYSRESSHPRDQTHVSCVSCIGRPILYHCTTWEVLYWDYKSLNVNGGYKLLQIDVMISAAAAAAKSLQLCPTLSKPIDSSPLGSPIPGILQARTLEWVAIAFSRWSLKRVKSEGHTGSLHVHLQCYIRVACVTWVDPRNRLFRVPLSAASRGQGIWGSKKPYWPF